MISMLLVKKKNGGRKFWYKNCAHYIESEIVVWKVVYTKTTDMINCIRKFQAHKLSRFLKSANYLISIKFSVFIHLWEGYFIIKVCGNIFLS